VCTAQVQLNIRKQAAYNTNHPIISKELHDEDTLPYYIHSAIVTRISGMKFMEITPKARQYMAFNISGEMNLTSPVYPFHDMTT